MRIAFLSNTRSGRGASRRAAREFPAALRAAGHEVVEAAVGDPEERVAAAIAGAAVLVVAGGDGTLHRQAGRAIAAGVAVYHVPCGNENLFARQFGMNRRPETLVAALSANRTTLVDVARVVDGDGDQGACSDVLALLMVSVGPDAGVIRRLTALRKRAIGHLAYIGPVVREWIRPSFPPLTVEVDGRRMIEGQRGSLLVANSRQYALRIDPAHRADMADGLLDVVFLPGARARSVLAWAARCRLRRDIERSGGVYVQGREARVSSHEPGPYQIDGDAPWCGAAVERPEAPLSLRVSVWPRALRVLLPVGAADQAPLTSRPPRMTASTGSLPNS